MSTSLSREPLDGVAGDGGGFGDGEPLDLELAGGGCRWNPRGRLPRGRLVPAKRCLPVTGSTRNMPRAVVLWACVESGAREKISFSLRFEAKIGPDSGWQARALDRFAGEAVLADFFAVFAAEGVDDIAPFDGDEQEVFLAGEGGGFEGDA